MQKILLVEEKKLLLNIAREAIYHAVTHQKLIPLDLSAFSKTLQDQGASFVTLTRDGALRGCVGTIEATMPLVLDVKEHAVAAALHDFRFAPVEKREVDQLVIEVSRLSQPAPIRYTTPGELPESIRIGIDGIVIRRGMNRATFLPQVWEKIPDPERFLSQLCLKLGCPAETWQNEMLDVSSYEVESFSEEEIL